MPGRIESDMDEATSMALNPKRLKGLEIVSVNSTENTYLYFAAPALEYLEREDEFFDSHEGFQPTFTYPFFGQEELWKGVVEGSLTICFDPKTFYAYVSFEVNEDAEELKDEILNQLTDKMAPTGWTSDWKTFIEHCNSSSSLEFGTLSGQFALDNKSYSIYSCNFEDGPFRTFHERVQLLLLFYIEASSYIDDQDLKWRAHMMFETTDGGRNLVGYTSLYPFLFYPDRTRLRLSQFLILPGYHRLGLGSKLYRYVYQQALDDPEIAELTVEDPSEQFSIFRLTNDLQIIAEYKELPARETLKFSEIEYDYLKQILEFKKAGCDEQNKSFRLELKKALWRRNKETMPDDPEAVKTCLQEYFEDRLQLFKSVLKL